MRCIFLLFYKGKDRHLKSYSKQAAALAPSDFRVRAPHHSTVLPPNIYLWKGKCYTETSCQQIFPVQVNSIYCRLCPLWGLCCDYWAVAAWKEPESIGKRGCGGRVSTKLYYRNWQWDEGCQAQRKGELVPVVWDSCGKSPRGHIYVSLLQPLPPNPKFLPSWAGVINVSPLTASCVFFTEKGEYRHTSFSDHQSSVL